jgi:hypothetical protein
MNVATFWDIASCSPYVNRRFGGTYHLHFQSRKLAVGFLLGLSRALKIEVIYGIYIYIVPTAVTSCSPVSK